MKLRFKQFIEKDPKKIKKKKKLVYNPDAKAKHNGSTMAPHSSAGSLDSRTIRSVF